MSFPSKCFLSRNLKTIFRLLLLKVRFEARENSMKIFPCEKLLKRGQIALFSIVRLKQGTSLKPTLFLNSEILNYLVGF